MTSKKKSAPKPIKMPEHYTSIDYMPMLNWDKIHKTMDMSFLLVKPVKINDAQRSEFIKVWEAMYNEFVTVFGFSEQVKDVAELELKIAKLTVKKIITKDESLQNIIRSHKKQLELMKEKRMEGDVYQAKQAIEKHFGMRIPMAEVSVREFYSYLNNMKANG